MMGDLFIKDGKFCGFVLKYIFGMNVQDEEIDRLKIIKSQNLEHFHGYSISNFPAFNVVCLRGYVLISSIFVTELKSCRNNTRKLVLDPNWKSLTVYHAARGMLHWLSYDRALQIQFTLKLFIFRSILP